MGKRLATQTVLTAVFCVISYFIANFVLAVGLEVTRIIGNLIDIAKTKTPVGEEAENQFLNIKTETVDGLGISDFWGQIKTFSIDLGTAFQFHEGYTWYYFIIVLVVGYYGVVKPFYKVYFSYVNAEVRVNNDSKKVAFKNKNGATPSVATGETKKIKVVDKETVDKEDVGTAKPSIKVDNANKSSGRAVKGAKPSAGGRKTKGINQTANVIENVLVVEEVTRPMSDEVMTVDRIGDPIHNVRKVQEEKSFINPKPKR